MITVTALDPTTCPGEPALDLPTVASVAGLLRVRAGDGRRFSLVQDDLLESLVFLAAGSAVTDEEDVLSLDQFPAADGERIELQLRVGLAGEEIAAWPATRTEIRDDIRLAWALVEDAAYSWGDSQLLYDLHDPGGKWTHHLQTARRADVSV